MPQNKTDITKTAKLMLLCFKLARFALFIMVILQAYALFFYIKSAESYPGIQQWAAVVSDISASGETNGAASLTLIERIFTLAMMAYAVSPITKLFNDMAQSGEPFAKAYAFCLQKCALFMVFLAVVPTVIISALSTQFTPDSPAAFSPNLPVLLMAAVIYAVARVFFCCGVPSPEVSLDSFLGKKRSALKSVKAALPNEKADPAEPTAEMSAEPDDADKAENE